MDVDRSDVQYCLRWVDQRWASAEWWQFTSAAICKGDVLCNTSLEYKPFTFTWLLSRTLQCCSLSFVLKSASFGFPPSHSVAITAFSILRFVLAQGRD